MLWLIWSRFPHVRHVAMAGSILLALQWGIVPSLDQRFVETWFWSIAPSWYAPVPCQFGIMMLLLLFPWQIVGWAIPKVANGLHRLTYLPLLLGLLVFALFWSLRVQDFVLGDACRIVALFGALKNYETLRQPLEVWLKTDTARLLYLHWGLSPLTTFQLISCVWGAGVITWISWDLFRGQGLSQSKSISVLSGLFLVGTIHLFFGYVEWYTQLSAGLLLFTYWGCRYLATGKGMWAALMGLGIAVSSHLVGLLFVPGGLWLIWLGHPNEKGNSPARVPHLWIKLFGALLVVGIPLLVSLWVVGSSIDIRHHCNNTKQMLGTILPLMEPNDPSKPVGSWHYAWLCRNHITDLINLMVLCGLFPILLLIGTLPAETNPGQLVVFIKNRLLPWLKLAPGCSDQSSMPGVIWFLAVQVLLSMIFVVLWNPWLGFPGDWDLFSLFTWPLLAVGILTGWQIKDSTAKHQVFQTAAIPAASVVFSWILFYSGLSWPTTPAITTPNPVEVMREDYRLAVSSHDWKQAESIADRILSASPQQAAWVSSQMDRQAVQAMADEWPLPAERLPDLAIDMEVISASPVFRSLILDRWGRIFMKEGPYLNAWYPHPLPGLPERYPVDMEVVPWRESIVILCNDGTLFELPIDRWVEPYPSMPLQTRTSAKPPRPRQLKPMGNFFDDYAQIPLGRGHQAVTMEVDHYNQRLVVLDSIGRLLTDRPFEMLDPGKPFPLLKVAMAMQWDGSFAFVCDRFGEVTAWPGGTSPVEVLLDFDWPAVIDMEIQRGGTEVYLMDVKGGMHQFSSTEEWLVNTKRAVHYAPDGTVLKQEPFYPHSASCFVDLEMLPMFTGCFRLTGAYQIFFSN